MEDKRAASAGGPMGYDDTNWSTSSKLCQAPTSVDQYMNGTMEREHQTELQSSWNVMAHGNAQEEKWRGHKRMEWVTTKRHMTAEHRLARQYTLQAEVHSSPASSRLNWCPRRFKWIRPFRRKTKSGVYAYAITFQT